MKPEQAFYQLLRPHLPGHPERIENAAGAGTPDFHCIDAGETYWVECKVSKSHNYDIYSLLEPSQRAWGHRYVNDYGGNLFYIVRHKDEISLFDGHFNRLEKIVKPFEWKLLGLVIRLNIMQK